MRQTHRLAIVGLVLFAGLAFLPWVSLQGEEFRWQSFGTLYQSDLEIEKTSNPPVPLLVGDQLPYTLTVRNLGPNDATGVVVDDALAANTSYVSDTCGGVYSGGTNSWSWTIGPLAANAQTACGLTVLVTGTGTLTNTAMVSGDQNDPTLANDSSTAVDRSVGANVPGLTPAGLAALVALLAAVSVVLLRRPR